MRGMSGKTVLMALRIASTTRVRTPTGPGRSRIQVRPWSPEKRVSGKVKAVAATTAPPMTPRVTDLPSSRRMAFTMEVVVLPIIREVRDAKTPIPAAASSIHDLNSTPSMASRPRTALR
jgi:hypothetical protein